jgi:type I restriction enzyme R subunit
VWQAYEQLEKVNGSTKNELIALVSLVRKISGIDSTLTPFNKTVDKNFQEWIFKKQAGTLKYTEEQVQWLRMIKDYIANSFHVDREDFELDPFNKQGGLGTMWQLFGEQTDEIIATMKQSLRRTLVLKVVASAGQTAKQLFCLLANKYSARVAWNSIYKLQVQHYG